MNRIKFTTSTLLSFFLMVFAVSLHGQEKKILTFEQIFKGAEPKILAPLPNITGWADDNNYLEMKKKEGDDKPKLYSVNVKTGKEKLYRDLDQFKTIADTNINLNSPAAHTKEYDKLIYIRENDLYLLDTKKKEFKQLTQTASEEKNPTFSPDGKHVAFTRDNNLFTIDIISGKEYQYTNDGTDVIYNGWAAWIYYEEIFGRSSKYRAFWWSADSRTIAFYRFDETKVPVFPLFNSDGVHGTLENTRYPKAGDPNPEVRVGFVQIGRDNVVWADFNEKDDQYFGTPFWTPDGKQLFVQWMNRQQDTLVLYSIQPTTGNKREVYVEHQASWIDWFESIDFLKGNKDFILKSDKDGWTHLYLYLVNGILKNRITQGKWNVSDILFVDESCNVIYFTAKKEVSTSTDLYKAKLDGTDLTRLTFGNYTHSIKLSSGGKYFITTYSNTTSPSKMALHDNRGKLVKELGDSKTKEFDDYKIATADVFRVPTADGYNLPVSWILPIDFDESKQYPILISIYGGPSSGTVSNSWGNLRSQWLAIEGVIQVAIDHRGSGHFGKEGAALMHRNLGKWEMNDYIGVVKWLRAKPFVDTNKICITGGSYGGFVTCLALTYGADYFTHGLSLFSVTDFRLYDSHYTERYMDTPAENPEGYKNASAMTFADRYKGMLRIVHGMMDDNVHMQNSIQLINKLQEHNKHFEFMLYPGERHGWGGTKATHLRNETYRFYYKYLLEKELPENLFK
ncbi:MAG: DPP IV N-terminal domain-containing protein [Bacteroidota bacterium]|nr:DPP IV N-terminal domain-containing protein [Bacteroidota bacterium]